MHKCNNPDFPHCSQWVLPGAETCASFHRQGAQMPPSAVGAPSFKRPTPNSQAALPDAFVAADDRPPPTAKGNITRPEVIRPHLHISGFDPRAAGGRQFIKIDLRGVLVGAGSKLEMELRSDLIATQRSHHQFARATSGNWLPVLIEFSSRNRDYGQYQIAVELKNSLGGATSQRWICTLVILVPRPDASLREIHDTFLGTHKNVTINADDASIAKVSSRAGGSLNMAVSASNAAIAEIDIGGPHGKFDIGVGAIAWDEDLIEIDVPCAPDNHPQPSKTACLVNPANMSHTGNGGLAGIRHIRLFALDECVFGRLQQIDPEADALLAHFGPKGMDLQGMTSRISGRHAIIRPTPQGFEIEDVSRYGTLIDGDWPGKHKPVALRPGMRVELSNSFKGVVQLKVVALLPHALVLQRQDEAAQCECFYLLKPETIAAFPPPSSPVGLPLLIHRQGGFWHLDPETGHETALTTTGDLRHLHGMRNGTEYIDDPYPDVRVMGYRAWQGEALAAGGMATV